MKTAELNSSLRDKTKEEIIDKYIELYKEHEKIKRKLRKYENPHTPQSKDERVISRSNFVSKTGLPVGKNTGYKGATREKKQPTDFISSFDNVCSQCGKRNKAKAVKTKIYEEIPEPQPTKIVK